VLKRTAKLVTATLVAAALTLAAAGCSKGGATSTNAATPGGTQTLTMWTHNAGNKTELPAIQQIVDDYNASQTKYKVDVQAFPQDSYNQSVVAAAAAKKLPCILDIDGPNVPNWAWAGYLAPLEGMDDALSKYLPSVIGKWADKTYSFGYYDVALTMVSRKSVLEKYDIRIPTADQPWTSEEFTAALKTIRDSGDFDHPLDIATSFTGEWWPYAYSPFLQSFGGDLINRSDYKSAQGVLNGPEGVAWAKWFRSLVTEKYIPLKSGADPAKDFMSGKSAILYNGSWTAVDTRKKFGDDMKFSAQDKYVASVSKATTNIPATDAAAALVPGFELGGENDVFRQYAKKFAVLRPVNPGYPFMATEFTKTAQDILNGADPQQALDTAAKNIDANQESNNYFQ
jgi:multiple sugar transport system substrate-binding protein